MASRIHGHSLWQEVVLLDQAGEIGEGNALHEEGALQQRVADISIMKTLLACQQITGK